MRVSEPRVSLDRDQAVLSCSVAFGSDERTWRVGVPKELIRFVAPAVDPFLPLATLLASYLGEDLQVDQTLSPTQIEGLTSAAALFAQWWDWSIPNLSGLQNAAVPPSENATGFNPSAVTGPRGDNAGLLFTRGIDSTASLVAALDGSSAPVTHLLGIDGIEPNHSPRVAAEVWADTQAVADLVSLPLIRLTTNLREEADRLLPWGQTHGAVLVGTALVLSPLLATLSISQTVDNSHAGPHGSTSRLDPMWSTDSTRVKAVHSEMDRVHKAALVATRPALAAAIKVCWEGDTRKNCGRCLKCLHTMTCFELLGASELVESAFHKPFSSEAIRQLAGPGPATSLQQVIDAIDEDHAVLREAWEDYLSRVENGQRRGLAGLNPSARFAAAGGSLSPEGLVGWGLHCQQIPLSLDERHRLCAMSTKAQAPIDWCLADRKDAGSVELAAELTDHWTAGAVLIVDAEISGAPPGAVSRLLSASKVRCWLSDSPHLDGIRLIEAIEHGCVPIQFMDEQHLRSLCAELPQWASPLVRSMQQVELGLPNEAELQLIFQAAVQLAVLGSPPVMAAS